MGNLIVVGKRPSFGLDSYSFAGSNEQPSSGATVKAVLTNFYFNPFFNTLMNKIKK